MKSGKLDVYRPPGGRTERQVAADVIVRLLEGGVLSRTPSVIARAAAAVGIPVELVRRSWATQSAVKPDRTSVGVGDDLVPLARPEPVYSPNYSEKMKAANAARRARKEPVPGKRICSRCRELKPVEAFPIKNKRTGGRRSMCGECFRSYQRNRYLSVEQGERLKTLLRFVVGEEDHLEGDCITCQMPIEVGQEVVADDVKLSHASCST
jgi:hypothetical protein